MQLDHGKFPDYLLRRFIFDLGGPGAGEAAEGHEFGLGPAVLGNLSKHETGTAFGGPCHEQKFLRLAIIVAGEDDRRGSMKGEIEDFSPIGACGIDGKSLIVVRITAAAPNKFMRLVASLETTL